MTSNSAAQRPTWWPARLETARLTLRPVAAADLPSIERLWRDERVRRYLGGPVSEDKIALRRRHLPGMPGAFATEDRTSGSCIGLVTVEPDSPRDGTEVSYTFLPEWWGHGLAREAVAAAVEWARDLPGGSRVVAVTQSANAGSRHLLEAIGLSADHETVEYGEPQTVYVAGPRRGAVSATTSGLGP
ncbi:GNAT family N-acetyltransferase [Streptomyces sp. NPDC021098]|uniref:GNAT family N-acetyltransferase n=1 Tax=unclassified Streptomyces TaxID=2593676 RepID=UPI003790F179